MCVCKSLQSCPTLCDPMDCSPPGSSVHGILQARMLEWVAMTLSTEYSQPRCWTCILCLLHWQSCSLPLVPPVQFSSIAQSCLTLCDPKDCRMPGFPVHHQHPEFTQTHVHQVGDAIQPSHPLPSPSPPALNLSQHQGLCKWVSSLHQVAKELEFQLQHQPF